jgi:hypothetical protein
MRTLTLLALTGLGDQLVAPVAAWLARFVAPRILGSTVGGLIVLLNARTLLADWFHLPGTVGACVYVVLYGLWAAALAHSVRAHRREKDIRTEPAEEPQPVGAAPERV